MHLAYGLTCKDVTCLLSVQSCKGRGLLTTRQALYYKTFRGGDEKQRSSVFNVWIWGKIQLECLWYDGSNKNGPYRLTYI